MNEWRSEETLVRYYCTAGCGMERFLIDEVKHKLAAEDVCQIAGKVLFSSSAEISRVCQLKAAERLFLLLKQDSPVCLTAYTSPAKAASMLQSKLLGDRNEWTSGVMTWNRLQRELAHRKTSVNTPSTSLKGTSEREEEKYDVESRKGTGGQIVESANGRRRSGEQNGAQPMEKKRKRHNEDAGEERRTAAQNLSSERGVESELASEGKEERGIVSEFSGSDRDDTTPGLVYGVKGVETVTTTGGRDQTVLEPSRIKPEPPLVPVSFRISCKCTGSLSRYFSTQELSRIIGVGLSQLLGWKPDLKNPQLEVNVYLSNDHCLLGIPLIRLPLANRCYTKTTGLRSTVAWAMASLAQIQPGFCVVDPMCGVGTILIEAAQEHTAARFLGVDIDDGQLQKATENIEFAELGNRVHLLKASSMMLPLPSASVDAVVCDLPFGRKFGTKTNMADNLPHILSEIDRVLCVGGTLVLLLSPQLSCLLKKLLAQRDAETTSNKELKPLPCVQECPSLSSASTRRQTLQIPQGINLPPTQETGPQSGLQHSLSLLKHQATFRVSLGMIDGLIHKYVKIHT